MGRPCTVCNHGNRDEIDTALVGREPNRRVAARFAVTEQAIRRHWSGHVPQELAKAQEVGEIARADTLLGQLKGLQVATLRILGEAEAVGDIRTALVAIHEARATLELLARLWFWPGHKRTGEPGWIAHTGTSNGVGRVKQAIREMPQPLREQVGRWLLERRDARLRGQREAVEARMRTFMPPEQPNPDGDGTQ